MAYDEALAQRIRQLIARKKGFTEKKMFGGIGFLLNGNMCMGVWKDSLIARIDPGQYASALEEPDVRKFDITGREMRGWVLVDQAGIAEKEQLAYWLRLASLWVGSLPAK